MTGEADLPGDTHQRVTGLISSGAADLPLPGAGQTPTRWAALPAIGPGQYGLQAAVSF